MIQTTCLKRSDKRSKRRKTGDGWAQNKEKEI